MSTARTGVGIGILLGLLMSVLLWAVAEPAQAQTVDECQADIGALKVQTQNATFVGQNAAKDQAGLIGKLDSASAKVVALDQQGKIDHEDALLLIAGSDEAIACVQGLIDAQAPTAA